jgi:thioredoxin 1
LGAVTELEIGYYRGAESLGAVFAYLTTGGTELMSENPNVQEVSDSSFDGDILKSDKPVLVDFWAPWCGPCRSVAPIVEDLATQYKDKIKVAKVNVDESSQVAMKYQVTSIPTFILFKGGEVADRVLGALPRSEFVKFIDRNLSEAEKLRA